MNDASDHGHAAGDRSSHAHHGDAHHGHAHHGHSHGPSSPHPPSALPLSMLRLSLTNRLAIAAGASVALWVAVWLALR